MVMWLPVRLSRKLLRIEVKEPVLFGSLGGMDTGLRLDMNSIVIGVVVSSWEIV